MQRSYTNNLTQWLHSANRKPLVLRGARQVGKTWLVRSFAKQEGKLLIELNLEKQPHLASLFTSNDPKQILLNLSASLNQKLPIDQTLLFIDEIQASPELFSKLRWFAEDLPELPVIAAGSLLDFVLAKHTFSMPVGRIGYMHIEPLSFEEFLYAQNKEMLVDYLANYRIETVIPAAIHLQLSQLFQEYILVGGLPAAVLNWVTNRSLLEVNQIHQDLLATYRDDFYKYNGRLPVERLEEVMMAVPQMLGEKFVYNRVNPTLRTETVKQGITLLRRAKICYPVVSCAANGIPLGAELNSKFFKEIFLDTGLSCNVLGLNLRSIPLDNLTLINKGAIAEQVVGQQLRLLEPFFVEPKLYYWQRHAKNSNAEIDYVIQHANQVIPIEVKSGSTGSLKSLHLFMETKGFSLAVRINNDLPSQVQVKTHSPYTLLSLPFYLVGQLHRLLGKR